MNELDGRWETQALLICTKYRISKLCCRRMILTCLNMDFYTTQAESLQQDIDPLLEDMEPHETIITRKRKNPSTANHKDDCVKKRQQI